MSNNIQIISYDNFIYNLYIIILFVIKRKKCLVFANGPGDLG